MRVAEYNSAETQKKAKQFCHNTFLKVIIQGHCSAI